jgi:hypothetical protein
MKNLITLALVLLALNAPAQDVQRAAELSVQIRDLGNERNEFERQFVQFRTSLRQHERHLHVNSASMTEAQRLALATRIEEMRVIEAHGIEKRNEYNREMVRLGRELASARRAQVGEQAP